MEKVPEVQDFKKKGENMKKFTDNPLLVVVTMIVLLFSGNFFLPAQAGAQDKPIIFVHGGAGSAAQFESQAMRFASNGYTGKIAALEYDSSFSIETLTDVQNRLDALIDVIRTETGADKVHLVGHSLGTFVSRGYMATPARAAKIAKYINIDAGTGSAPTGVPTLAIWAGMGTPGRSITGATNVTIANQYHVEVATSAEGFAEMYKFLTGDNPVTTMIVPEPCDQIKLAGRAVFFPLNTGVAGTLEIWEVNSDTGARIGAVPKATYTLGADGSWGPFDARGGQNYEFVILREGLRPHHFYFEPFIRSSYFVRLNTSPPGGVGEYMDQSSRHSNLVITRNMEFRSGDFYDILEVNGYNVLTPLTPISKWLIGMFVYDQYADGLDNLTGPIPYYHGRAFLSGVDLYVPGAEPPNGTIPIVLTSRSGGGQKQIINVPNWASSHHAISVQFNDYFQVDTTPPVVKITTPADGGEYLLNSVVLAYWTATDERCVIASAVGTVPNGSPIDTATVGAKTFTVTAADKAGNVATKTVTYYVDYVFGGILPPINPNRSSDFKLGSTIPVKFQLFDAHGNLISAAVAKIYVAKISGGIIGSEMKGVSTSAANTDNFFRYSPTDRQYIFNLSTKHLSAGTWQIRIELDDGTSHYAHINLK